MATPAPAQSDTSAALVERMYAYLDAYEPKLSELVARPQHERADAAPELLGRHHAPAFVVRLDGRERIGGRQAVRLLLREPKPGAIIAHDRRQFVRTDVRAWVAEDGAVLRADVTLHPPSGLGTHRIRVEFAADPALGLLVPVRLTESFGGREQGDGTATYRNYRRFQTAGRILPPGR